MALKLTCPRCAAKALDVYDYESMIVISSAHAMFTMRCPECGTLASSVQVIPRELREQVRYAAIEVGAGMGREA